MFQFIKISSIPYPDSDGINWDKLQFIKPYCAIFAAFIVQLLVGGLLSIGNLLPYIASYVSYATNTALIKNSDNKCLPAIQQIYISNVSNANWIISASVIGYGVIGPFGGKLYVHSKSIRCTVLIGGGIVCISIYCTYYAIRIHSIVLIILLFGFAFGIGTGVFWGSSISAAIKWFPNHRGFVSGLVLFGMGSGQTMFDFVETLYINPKNINSSPHCGYILNAQIISRIPQCFIVLSAVCATVVFISTILFFDKPDHDCTNYIKTGEGEYQNISTDYNYTSSDALKTYQFWLIFCDCFFMITLLCFVYAEWKVFAQNYLSIDDDDFLLKLGTVASLTNASGRILWGYYLDKTHSYAISMGTATFILTFFLATMPLCSYCVNKKLVAFIWISVLYVCVGATYAIIPPTLTHTFGMKYSAVILGMVTWSDIPSSILQSSIVDATQNHWPLLCSIMAAIGVVSFLLAILYPMRSTKIRDESSIKQIQIKIP